MVHGLALLVCCVAQTGRSTNVLAETGHDYLETRLFTACRANLSGDRQPFLVVGGFTNPGSGDVSDVMAYSLDAGPAQLRWRTMWKGDVRSSIRTLRAADLDGDGHEEVVVLGRVGDEDVDSEAELRVLGLRKGAFNVLDSVHWQSGRYTHGYGMAIGDLDVDRSPEIVSSGFYWDGKQEHAEISVWRFSGGALRLLDRTHWGDTGETRVNAIDVGDMDGDGRLEIFSAGRTGQVKNAAGETTGERGQLTAWRFHESKLRRLASYEWDQVDQGRFREIKTADVDGDGQLEVFAGGRFGQEQRPYLGIFRVTSRGFEVINEPKWDRERLGELRDIAFHGQGAKFRVVSIGAEGVKPNRQGQLRIWKLVGPKHDLVEDWVVASGDENRVRQVVIWPGTDGTELVTVGFVRNGKQLLGQIVNWGKLP